MSDGPRYLADRIAALAARLQPRTSPAPPTPEEARSTVILCDDAEVLVELDGEACAACGGAAVRLCDVVLRGRRAIAPACDGCSRRSTFAATVEDQVDASVVDVIGDWPSLPPRRIP